MAQSGECAEVLFHTTSLTEKQVVHRIFRHSGPPLGEPLQLVRTHSRSLMVVGTEQFFYFFESRSNPKVDDVILWTNGGENPICQIDWRSYRVQDLGAPRPSVFSWS